jgi:hypothetical protein
MPRKHYFLLLGDVIKEDFTLFIGLTRTNKFLELLGDHFHFLMKET